MKVLVTVAEVAEVDDNFEIEGLEIDERYLQYDINEWDDYAVEEAVQLREEYGDVEVVSATIGPQRSEETIRMALAKGVDRAIRVWDDALEAVDLIDIDTKADILRAIIEEEAPDIVFTGVQAADDAFGATGVAVGERVGFEWAAVVNDFEFDPDSGMASIRRELEGGVEEISEVETPAVFTIQTGINEPRYASLRGIRQAQSKEIAVKTLADLDEPVRADSQLTLVEMYEPEAESEATIFDGTAEETAAQLAEVLREKGVGEA